VHDFRRLAQHPAHALLEHAVGVGHALPRFASLEKARAELEQLAGNGAVDAELLRR
jgi:hypothetical protein